MAISEDIAWFKTNFGAEILAEIKGTPISLDFVCAVAVQETGEIWRPMRHSHAVSDVLRLAVGDVIDAPRRKAFPRTKAELVGVPDGQAMFTLAHSLLGEMADATGIAAYKTAFKNPDKFCHAFGIFQNDLQRFKSDKDFFLKQKWTDFSVMFEKFMTEIKGALKSLGYASKPSLTDLESAFVAIVYNTGFGNFDAAKGLKQGFFDGQHYYGENIDSFLKIAHSVPLSSASAPSLASLPPPKPSSSLVLPSALPSPSHGSAVAAAKAEFDRYHGIDEGSEPLRSRIADYYEAGGGSRTLDPTQDANAWSAAFISFCIKQSGASSAQFAYSLQHSVFVHAAIGNALAGTGVFRGYPIGQHAVRLGDLVHHNRSGAKLTYEYARDHVSYASHSCLVVGFEEVAGVRHALTIGGNEAIAGGTGTVGSKSFPLDAKGCLDQSQIGTRLICVVENLFEASGTTPPVRVLGRYAVHVRDKSTLFVRGGPGSNFPRLDSVPNGLAKGTVITVLGFQETSEGLWALVDLQGDGQRDGFVSAAFIEPVPA
jgi:hypothetical protein